MNAGLYGLPGAELGQVAPSTELAAYFAAVGAAGGAMTALSQQVITRFWSALTSREYHRAFRAIYPFAGGDLAAARVPLRNRITGTTPTTPNLTASQYSEATGLQGNGAGYVLTDITPDLVGRHGGYALAVGGNLSVTCDMACAQVTGVDYRFVIAMRAANFFFTWGAQSGGSAGTGAAAPNGRMLGLRGAGVGSPRRLYAGGGLVASDVDIDATEPASTPTISFMATHSSAGTFLNICPAGTYLRFAAILDGSLTAAEVADWDALLVEHFLAPLGRV